VRTLIPGVLEIIEPKRAAAPVVLDSPHSGTQYPADFGAIAPAHVIRQAGDAFVDELFDTAPQCGASLLRALFPRAYIDPNRALEDIDQTLLDAAWPQSVRPSEKTRFGHGLVWRICPPNHPLYDRKLSVAEMRARIDTYWRPYHAALRGALDAAHRRFGAVWHINCHSMPTMAAPGALRNAPGWGDFVLGDRDGSTSAPEFINLIGETLAGFGYDVRFNDPYKGVELIRAYCDPGRQRHSVQIEINRSIYMDEQNVERNGGFAALRDNLTRLTEVVCAYARATAS
jgi:N-formylglutamate amidohydrolase